MAQEGGNPPGAAVFEVDSFNYRASFDLEDGTEALLIRAEFTVSYFYRHHHPTVSEHHMTAFLGFYYGRTILGRSVLTDIEVDRIAFYPWWHDSAGYLTDHYPDRPMFTINDSVKDGMLTYNTFLMDDEPISKVIPDFGGRLVFDELTFVLSDGTQKTISNGTIEILLEKNYNDLAPQSATLNSTEDLSYSADYRTIRVTTPAAAPLLTILDRFLVFSLMGGGLVFVVLMGLHIKGVVCLPFEKLRQSILDREGTQ
ncbi:hypothetical protein EU519_00960 [Candidatus Thorarchaeota archaeon]|nr:MAG: hypothetical protein EU519_00960 [Candidatus Thorarchaeota archaeon]